MHRSRRRFVGSAAAVAAGAALGPALPALAQDKVVWKASDVHPLG
jgi:hypothetical protein